MPTKTIVQGNLLPSRTPLRSCPLAGVTRTLSETSADREPHVQGASATLQGAGAREPASPRTSTSRGRWVREWAREGDTSGKGSHAAVLARPQCHLSGESPHARARTHVHTASRESASQSFSVQGALKPWHLPSTAKSSRQEPARALKPTPALARAGEWTVIPRCT